MTTDAAPLVEGTVRLGISRGTTDTDALAADLNELLTTDLSKPLGELSLGHVLASVLAVLRRHQLRFPPNLALLAKTLGTCEGLAAHLDPQFRMTKRSRRTWPSSSRPHRPTHRSTDQNQAVARRRVVSTMSTISPTVSMRAQSRCSSPARPTQLIGRAPACTMRSRPARCASSEVPPTASTTG